MTGDSLAPWEKAVLVGIAVALVGLGAITLARSAYMESRMTDAGVYFRAAWALRSGESPYRVTDDNGWHYHYSPLLAIALMPLADPPPGLAGRGGPWMPYPVSIVIWYAVNLLALAAALHLLACAIEATAPRGSIHDTPRGGRRWWRLRVLPLVVCATMAGFTLGRGQVSVLMALSLAGACAASIRGRSGRAGVWLAGGVCLKPFLAVVLLYPLLRGEKKIFGGFLAGLAIFLVGVPLAALGPARTAAIYGEWYELRVSSMAVSRVHSDISGELQAFEGDFPSWGTVWYKTLHPDRGAWPSELPPAYEALQILVGVALVAAVLAVSLRRAPTPDRDRLRTILVWGALVVAVLSSLSTCKPHYYALALLLVQGLIASAWELSGRTRLPLTWIAVFSVYGIAHALSEIVPGGLLSEKGIVPYAALLLLALGMLQLRRIGGTPALVDGSADDSPESAAGRSCGIAPDGAGRMR